LSDHYHKKGQILVTDIQFVTLPIADADIFGGYRWYPIPVQH